MSKAGLDNRNHDGEISHKHGNTLIRTLRMGTEFRGRLSRNPEAGRGLALT
jgi:hypothetical protein